MLGTKRRADDTILPLRAPKRPRTTTNHPLGGNSTPSQYDGLLSRWMMVGSEFIDVLRDTVVSLTRLVVGGANGDSSTASPLSAHNAQEQVQIPSPPPSPPPVAPPPPPPTSNARRIPARQPIPAFPASQSQPIQLPRSAPSTHGIHQRIPASQTYPRNEQRRTQPRHARPQPNAVASTSKNTLSGSQDPKVSGFPGDTKSTGLMSPPSTQASTSSILSALNQTYPEVGVALQQNPRRRKKSTKKQYIERDHIHMKKHKQRVKEVTKQTKEEMERDVRTLYDIRRSAGFGSDFDSFRSLLDYQARLEFLDKTGALSPSPSLGDLRYRARHDDNRRHSFPDHVDSDFIHRAIQKAQDTLNGPKPPKPFTPTLEQLRLSHYAKDEEIEKRLRPKRKPLPASLPPEDEAAVDAFFRKRGVIAKCVKEQVVDHDLSRLRPCQWLNDEVINFYGQMILSRFEEFKENPAAQNGQNKLLNVHYFNTFFWSKLKGQGYEKARLARWTKKIDIFSKDVILIPVNHNNAHWTAATINFRKKRIESYDSMGMARSTVFKLLRQYLDEEHRNKKRRPFDFTDWEDYVLPDTPQQENGFDCGVFTCQFLEALSRGEEYFSFSQANMPYLRRKMVWEIGNVKLRDIP